MSTCANLANLMVMCVCPPFQLLSCIVLYVSGFIDDSGEGSLVGNTTTCVPEDTGSNLREVPGPSVRRHVKI